jgi:photosystem II stability/assembly factor-like uncharacterized protein
MKRPERLFLRHPLRPAIGVAILMASLILSSLTACMSQVTQPATSPTQTVQQQTDKHSFHMSLDEDRLYMFNEQAGWAIGGNPSINIRRDGLKGLYNAILHTSDGGKHWQQVTPPGFSSDQDLLDFTLLDSNTAWVSLVKDGEQKLTWFYQTTDAGKTWQSFPLPDPLSNLRTMSFINEHEGWMLRSKSLAGTPPTGNQGGSTSLMHTTDGGKTWQNLGPLSIQGGVWNISFFNQQLAWAQGCSYISCDFYKTHDGGKTWQKQTLPLPSDIGSNRTDGPELEIDHIKGAGMIFLSGQEIAMLTRYDQNGQARWYAYTSQDEGNTWQVSGDALLDLFSANYQFLDGNHLVERYTSPADQLFYNHIALLELNGGKWVKTSDYVVPLHDFEDMWFTSAQVGFIEIATPGPILDIYRTNDGGKTWQKMGTLPQTA